MPTQKPLYYLADEDRSDWAITNHQAGRLRNVKEAKNAGAFNGDNDYPNNTDASKSCTNINDSGAPWCYFLNDQGEMDQNRAKSFGMTNPSGYSRSGLKNCPGTSGGDFNYKTASFIFNEESWPDDSYKLCKREVTQTDKSICCLTNDDKTANACDDGVYYQSGTCNEWVKDRIPQDCNMNDTRNDNDLIDLSDNSTCKKYRNANETAFNNYAWTKCAGPDSNNTNSQDYRGMINYNQCQKYYGDGNDFFRNKAKEYCTENSRLFNENNKCLKQGSNFVNTPAVVQTYIDEKRVQFCNTADGFTTTNCSNLIKAKPEYFDSIASQKCTDYTVEPCKTFSNPLANYQKMPINSLKEINACIDANNKLINSTKCITLASETTNAYSNNLLEPSLNYCRSGTNATDVAFCQGILPQQISRVSGFSDYHGNSDPYNDFINIAFLIILICMFVGITYKYNGKIMDHDFFSCYK